MYESGCSFIAQRRSYGCRATKILQYSIQSMVYGGHDFPLHIMGYFRKTGYFCHHIVDVVVVVAVLFLSYVIAAVCILYMSHTCACVSHDTENV